MQVSGKTKLSLSRWPEYTDDDHVLLNTDALLTVCEPAENVKQAYIKKCGITEEELTPKETAVMLNESEQVPGAIEDDEYEPRYVEEPLY